ncbi:MAG: ABC transporter permease [bacterium]
MEKIVHYMLPGLSLMGYFFLASVALTDIVIEREQGTLRRVLSGPVTVGQFLAAKVLVAAILCVAAELTLVAISRALFGMRWGSPMALMTISLGMVLAVVGVLTLVHGLAKTRSQADALSHLVIMAMCLFGGSFLPLEDLPGFMEKIGRWTINYWAIKGMRACANGASVFELLPIASCLAILGIATLSAGAWIMRRRLLKGDYS